jgi:hypothetical protein
VAKHWASIVKKADKEDMQSLGQMKSYIQKKTQHLDKFLSLKGKLEMVGEALSVKT